MIDDGPAAPAALRPAPVSLFDPGAFPRDAYGEAFSPSRMPREHWQPLMAALDAMGADVLGRRQDRVRRMRHEDGATYNPFDDPSGRGIPWALELIPLPLTAGEWSELEAGLIQRAGLLERILADVYGPQNLLKEGRIPPPLVFANPRFLRACHGIAPAGGRYLTYYAADVYRGADGRFRVLRDHGGNPAGLGYALENRIVISRVFPELYPKAQIQRLAPFFHAFHRSLARRAARRREEPGIVLLSPGPDSRIYFEHALLSRYLGYPLVEGQDLTVRNGEVFLKKLAGLEAVDAIFRHTEDDRSDPFALRRDAPAGVAGLVQVCREGNIDVVNPLGSGFVDTPVLPVFLPALCRLLLGEDLALESHPVWWCGAADGMARAGSPSGEDSVVPALEPAGQAAAMAGIQAARHAFMVREAVRPAVVPAWSPDGIRARRVFMRLFVCATDEGFAVMPGGLAVTASEVQTLTGGLLEQQQSKDIWVLSDRPVEPFSLMGGLQSVSEFRRSNDLPSRVADHLLWLGRYLERAEGLIRLLRSVFRRLSGETPPGEVPELPFLLNLLRALDAILPASGQGQDVPLVAGLSSHLDAALFRKDRPESVVALLKRVREAARNVRDRLSLDAWRVINRLDGFADAPAGDPLELLDDTLFTLSAFSGLAMESMTRGLGWRFMDMGRRLERGLNQTRLIGIGLPGICAESRGALEALLEVSDSIMTYRARYRTTFLPAPVLDLLIADESNPKSLSFQFDQLAAHAAHLPREGGRQSAGPEERMALEMLDAARRLDLTGFGCDGGARNEALAVFLASTESRLKDFARQVGAAYLTRVPTTPHFSMIRDHGEP